MAEKEVWRFAPWKFEPFGRSLETFQEFPIRRRRFPIWCAVAKPHGMDADAWCLHQCVSYLCASVSLCLCVSQPRRASASRVPSPSLCASVSLCESTSLCVSFPCSIAPSPSVPLCLCVSPQKKILAKLGALLYHIMYRLFGRARVVKLAYTQA